MTDRDPAPTTPEPPRSAEERLPYTAPRLTVHGPLDRLTQIRGGTPLPDSFADEPV